MEWNDYREEAALHVVKWRVHGDGEGGYGWGRKTRVKLS